MVVKSEVVIDMVAVRVVGATLRSTARGPTEVTSDQ